MSQLAILKFTSDSSKSGFIVSLEISRDGDLSGLKIDSAYLPNYPQEIKGRYLLWKERFQNQILRNDARNWQFGVTEQRSESEDETEVFQQIVSSLEDLFNAWLINSEDRKWIEIREALCKKLTKSHGAIQVAIESDPDLWILPWSEWDILKDYDDIAISYHLKEYGENQYPPCSLGKVRILAIFGDDSGGLNFDTELNILKRIQAKDADCEILTKPSYEEFIDTLQHPKGWNILFFAGHGATKDKTGRIWIKEDISLTISEFNKSLRQATQRGLKLVILNCCEGISLAVEISKINLPTVIYMQGKVPDEVATFFVNSFLNKYTSNHTLRSAFRQAQISLERFNKKIPGVHWYPKLYQHPGEEPISWEQLKGTVNSVSIKSEETEVKRDKRSPVSDRKHLLNVILISILVTSLVMGMRWFGFLQTSELQAFDRLMQQRPAEKADPRILVVGADEADIDKYDYPLPDAILSQLIDKLEEHKPVVIGLDIIRDKPVEPGHKQLVTHFQQNKRLISPCALPRIEQEEIKPPPQALKENLGFVDLESDLPYETVRRYVLTRDYGDSERYEQCATDHSLAFQLAYRYLYSKGIIGRYLQYEKAWQFKEIMFKQLQPHSGGYHRFDSGGHQILLNYRVPTSKKSALDSSNIAQFVTVKEILENQFKPEWIKDRVVLIAMTAESTQDRHNTTQGGMRGVWIHAQMVSQILSTVEDKRPLIWWLPIWGDALWVGIWSSIGGILVYYWRYRLLYLIFGISISVIILYAISFISILQGLWLPLIPSVIVLLVTGCTSALYFSKSSYR